MPFYTALTRDEFVHSDASLDALLAFVLDVIDPAMPEDVTIWANNTVAAVVLACGRVVRFDAPAPPAAPADLAAADEGAVEDAACPRDGTGKTRAPGGVAAAGVFFVDLRGRPAYHRQREFRH
jgi:hypothetical protein